MTYLGFSIEQMLYYLNMFCSEVTLKKEGSFWRLHVLSDDYGEFEMYGSLLRVVPHAFKPFFDKARADRNRKEQWLSNILKQKG